MTTSAEMGTGQSPIDISDWAASDAHAPMFDYASNANRVERAQGFVMFHFDRGSQLLLGDASYGLLQFHWHTPAEHTIEGDEFAAEVHFVHVNEDDQLLVVGTVYRLGEADEGLEQIIAATPPAGEEGDVVPRLSAAYHVPDSDDFFHYVGSLTAAPFSEPVQWYVARTIRTISQRQVEQLEMLAGGANARPLQDLNQRTILCVGCAI
ncbi:MAG: carbonic anhydrase family protein [Chloroflexi bacterium]|nr:carbonic anhydrase family protein [Chloroflexota bacterium]